MEPVEIDWDDFTFTKKMANGAFTINIYSTNSQASDKFLDAVINAVETHRTTLFGLGMYMVQLTNTDYDNVIRGGFKVHRRTCTFSYRFDFTKTYP